MILEKFIDLGPTKTGKLSVFLNIKPEMTAQSADQLSALSIGSPFVPMYYSMTSNYLMELVYLTSTEGELPTRHIHKSINLREVMNLLNAEKGVGKSNSLTDNRIYFGDIKQMAMFLVDRVKSANLFENPDEQHQD